MSLVWFGHVFWHLQQAPARCINPFQTKTECFSITKSVISNHLLIYLFSTFGVVKTCLSSKTHQMKCMLFRLLHQNLFLFPQLLKPENIVLFFTWAATTRQYDSLSLFGIRHNLQNGSYSLYEQRNSWSTESSWIIVQRVKNSCFC